MRSKALLLSIIFASSCVNVTGDEGEGVDEFPRPPAAEVEFDPGASVVPFPNSLLLSPSTGRVTLPPSCGESPSARALREGALNALDGFGTFKGAQRITFSEPVDMDSIKDRVVLYQYTSPRGMLDPLTAVRIPVLVLPSQTKRSSKDCKEASVVAAINVIPLVPLEENSNYITAVRNGVAGVSGKTFLPSKTWSLVRQSEDPVTIKDGKIVAERTPFDPKKDADRLIGLDLLWKVHAAGLLFLDGAEGLPRSEWALAYPFKTQSITTPLDATVPGSPAATLSAQPLLGVNSVTGGDVQAFLKSKLTEKTCAAVGCENVGDVVAGALLAPRYQIETPNLLPGGISIPGPWSDPVKPVALATPAQIPVLAILPAAAAPEGGYPTVVFGHGLTRSKGDALAIASQLAKFGIATVAMDWPNHGARAVQVNNEDPRGCGGTPDPTQAVQCFAPFVSSNLVVTRDNFRQGTLDATALIKALKGCTGGACGGLAVNPKRIGYLGQSLGAIIGTSVVAMNPDVRGAVLNVGGGGLVDLVENTDSLAIRCSLVDALIHQKIVVGEVSNPQTGTGTCFGQEWKTQPGYQSFAVIGRWILDPGDAINYTARLRGRHVLLQKVTNDEVVPNIATDQQARVLGLTSVPADKAEPGLTPTAALLGNADPHFVTYTNLPAQAPFLGNTFTHGSLLRPSNANFDGSLGTARLQSDAVAYLVQILNLPVNE